MKKLILGSIITFASLSAVNAQTSFPYSNPLTTINNLQTSANGVTIDARYQGLQVAPNENQAAYFSFKDLKFSTTKGFNIDFTYVLWPKPAGTLAASGKPIKDGLGFTFVLYDASTPLATVTSGTFNAGLGYVYNATLNTGFGNGFSNAYLGIAFDVIGENKATLANYLGATFGWNYRAGINGLSDAEMRNGSNVTIRGGMNKNYPIPGSKYYNIYGGYPVLQSQATNYNTTGTKSRYVLDTTTGEHDGTLDPVPSGGSFNIMSNEYTSDPTNPNYRRALISLLPGTKDKVVGFYINVQIYYGTQLSSVIKDFFIDSSSSSTVKYNDIAKFQTSTTDSDITTVSNNMSLAPPSNLGIAIAACSGEGYSLNQVFSNVNILLPYAPILPDGVANNTCSLLGRSTTFSVLDGAIGYNNNVYIPDNPPVGKRAYIDQASFKFRMVQSDGSFVDSTDPYKCETLAGTYTYNPSTGFVTYVASNTAKTLTQDVIYYSIRNLPPTDTSLAYLATDEYRSRTARTVLTLTSDDCPPIPNKYVKINK